MSTWQSLSMQVWSSALCDLADEFMTKPSDGLCVGQAMMVQLRAQYPQRSGFSTTTTNSCLSTKGFVTSAMTGPVLHPALAAHKSCTVWHWLGSTFTFPC